MEALLIWLHMGISGVTGGGLSLPMNEQYMLIITGIQYNTWAYRMYTEKDILTHDHAYHVVSLDQIFIQKILNTIRMIDTTTKCNGPDARIVCQLIYGNVTHRITFGGAVNYIDGQSYVLDEELLKLIATKLSGLDQCVILEYLRSPRYEEELFDVKNSIKKLRER